MREVDLQVDIARTFSERYPKKRGQLFHVSNERNSKIQAFRARAIGIIAGVADFVFFSKAFNVATELKTPGSRHEVAIIQQQVDWGRTWEREGGIWRLCTTTEEAISCYEGNFKGYTLDEMQAILDSVKTKTFKIQQWQERKTN